MVVQRIYETDLDMETVRGEILRNQTDFGFVGDSRLLSFRLLGFKDYLIQLSPRRHFLMIHGLQPHGFLRDLQITMELARKLSSSYPNGISFKLCRERIPAQDWKGMQKAQQKLSMFLMRGEQSRKAEINQEFRTIESSEEERGVFAEELGNVAADMLCMNGFTWKRDGTLEPNRLSTLYQNEAGFRGLIEEYVKVCSDLTTRIPGAV